MMENVVLVLVKRHQDDFQNSKMWLPISARASFQRTFFANSVYSGSGTLSRWPFKRLKSRYEYWQTVTGIGKHVLLVNQNGDERFRRQKL